ncbi:ABC transporter ATP-binding protein [Microbacterium amylolyticum]|uniref:ABC-type multidrug transport system ATPase subunit n=1 Tax=Microbacterium amylolyticum TaxID=936337 RepID=A0ABS4ZI05_9MICO|nr:ABC transporter ATP-binding protein [Microbacterium amylolyticum]MBP2436910.1 ABC-type multidrug transport system ATPase subunit [Microbacterium amylolyticum]
MNASDVEHDGIAVRSVARSFGPVEAVRDMTFDAHPGKITGLIGPNGSGKTTLFLMLASLLAPDSGTIRVTGIDPIADPAAARARLGWMPDALGAWDSLTVVETLVVAGRLYGRDRADARTRADELINEVGLDAVATSPARVLSRGQKQLLGLARALVHEPRALLLDEPASGLDPLARLRLRALLRRRADDGVAILVSSHVLSELEEMVDDSVFVSGGRTVTAPESVREWRIRVSGTPETGAHVWQDVVTAALPGVPVRVDRRDLFASFHDDAAASTALRALIAADVPVFEFAPAQGNLERAFLAMGEQS